MPICSLADIEGAGRCVIQNKDGRLYRLQGYWNNPVLILDPIEPDADGNKKREYICIGSSFAEDLSVLKPVA